MATLSRLQQLPAAGDALLGKPRYYALGNLVKVTCSQRQDRGARARQTHAQQPGLRGGRHGLHNLCETGDQRLAVRLVQLVLHGEVDEVWVGRRLAQRNGEERYTLEVEGLWWNVC